MNLKICPNCGLAINRKNPIVGFMSHLSSDGRKRLKGGRHVCWTCGVQNILATTKGAAKKA